MRDKNLARNAWPLAVVEELKPSKDGLTRSAYVRLGRGTKRLVHRAIHDLVVLVSKEQPSMDINDDTQ